jgi:hypothetical protein
MIQRTVPVMFDERIGLLPAADLGVIRIQQAVDRKPQLVPRGSTMLE